MCINLFFGSCAKDTNSFSESKTHVLNSIKEELNTIALKYNNLSKERIIQLQKQLDPTQIHTYSKGSKETFISIAIKDGLEHLKAKSFLVGKTDENNRIKFLQIINYSGNKSNKNSAELFANFYAQNKVYDGAYQVLNIIGNYQYELTFVNDKLAKLKAKSKKEKNLSTSTPLTLECEDWYWVTTYINEDGSTYQTWDYIGRTCEDNCPPNEVCELQGDLGGGGSPDTSTVSKAKNWTVGTGGGTPVVWRVYSDDNLWGKLNGDPVNKGYFTSVQHAGSNVTNYVGNEPGVPFSTWTQENVLPFIPAPGVATCYVKGKLTFYNGSTLPNIYNTGAWLFVNEF